MTIKIIIYIFLTSYAFVNVLADTIDLGEYIKELFITNKHMEVAFNTYGSHGRLNGLAYTLKRIIFGDAYTMEELNFMFAIPDQADVLDLNKYIGYQRKMQNEIIMALYIDRPLVNRMVLDWAELGNIRRKMSIKAIIQLFTNDIYHTNSGYYSLNQKCQLIGLALSTKYPLSYTKSVTINSYNMCVVKNVNDTLSWYKEFERNEFYEIIYDPYPKRGPKLISQLYFNGINN